MKILQLCPYAMDRPGGVQRHVRDLSHWLRQEGHDVRVIAPPMAGASPRRTADWIELGRARRLSVHGTGFEISLAAPWHVRRTAAQIREDGFDLVHNHTPWTPFLVSQMTRAVKLPVVTTVHATLPDPAGRSLIDRYITATARRQVQACRALIVPSQAPLEMLQRVVPEAQATILPPAIDLSRFAPSTKDGRHLVSLGRLEPRKGIDILVAAWAQIAEACLDVQLTVAGDGPGANLLKNAPRIRHVPAPDDTTLARIMAEADLFLAPAPYGESFGLVLAEAMAAGAVPIAAANPGYRAFLNDHPDLCVAPGDADALAARAIALLQDRERIDALRAWGLQHAQTADVRQAGPKYLEIYQRVLA